MMSDVYQPELGSESMDVHARAVPGNEAVTDGRMGKRMKETLMRGPRWVCQKGISKGRKEGRK